jgi:pyruvate/2-oxoglutarate dehydrogenase complex dihydrolipoamide dehydrogenase (E3) component
LAIGNRGRARGIPWTSAPIPFYETGHLPTPERFDAVIIGTGQAGKPLAGALADAGWRTAIVERGRVGGTCVIDGCTPTKTMVASARVAHLARRASDFGVGTGPVQVDLTAVRRRKRAMVDSFSSGSERGLRRHDALELIFGEARFTGPHEVEVRLNDGGARRLAAEKVFINAGARPAVPPIPGLDAVDFLDSTSIMELGEVPEHLVVLGGGFIGLEFAQMFRRFGAAVTIVERDARLAAREDEDVSEAIEQIFHDEGICVRTATEVVRVDRHGASGVEVQVRDGASAAVIRGSHLLVAAGRTPNTDVLDVRAAGLETDARGYLRVNERLETGVPGVYALGDIAGSAPFTHTAYDDYRVARTNLLEGGDCTTTGRITPYTVFIDPQLGRVGMTEREAREKGMEIRVAKLPMSRVARAIEVDETRGFMKAVVDARTDRILGAAILGLEGGEVVTVLQTAMMGDLPYTALRDAIFPHPTLAESLNNLFMAMDA